MTAKESLSRASAMFSSPAMNRLTILFVAVWFAASLLSQAFYMGIHGEPYSSMLLLEVMGPWYVLLIIIEVLVWFTLGLLVGGKVKGEKMKSALVPAR